MTTGKTIALTRRTFVGKVMSLFLPNVLYMILDSIQDTIHLSSALPVSSWLTVSQISLAFDDIESFEMYLYFVEYPSIEICQMFFIIRSVCVCVCVCVKLLQSCLSVQPYELQPARLLCPWDSPGKNTGVACHFLLQEIYPTHGSNPGTLHCRQILHHLSHYGSP